ncbi:MAG: OmpA family protein [Pseudomonadota bacterium]
MLPVRKPHKTIEREDIAAPMFKPAFTLIALTAALALGACKQRPEGGSPGPESDDAVKAEETGAVSILRPEVAPPDSQAETLTTLEATIGFPDGGDELDADAVAELEKVLASPQLKLSGPITLRAHSDSAGTDTANEDAAETRGLAVAAWLIGQGVDEDRIDVIVFGEQNPAEPNALPDGSPNEAGRKANRRVEIEVQVIADTPAAKAEGNEAASDDASVDSGD